MIWEGIFYFLRYKFYSKLCPKGLVGRGYLRGTMFP